MRGRNPSFGNQSAGRLPMHRGFPGVFRFLGGFGAGGSYERGRSDTAEHRLPVQFDSRPGEFEFRAGHSRRSNLRGAECPTRRIGRRCLAIHSTATRRGAASADQLACYSDHSICRDPRATLQAKYRRTADSSSGGRQLRKRWGRWIVSCPERDGATLPVRNRAGATASTASPGESCCFSPGLV